MFYSHEILTSREGGIATVWLVATLGSKANNKKVNRKSILEVDIKKTCDIIIQPEAPMALRLQGNLLYGVVRVHSRRYDYVLSDAETTQANMRVLLKAMKISELDPNARKARPGQLTIQDDPAFLPDLALPGLDIDLSALDISTGESSFRSSLSSARESDASILGLVVPSSASGGVGDPGGFHVPSGIGSSARGSVGLARLPDDDDAFNIDPGFSFDNDGLLMEEISPNERPTQVGNIRIGSDSTASTRVRQDLIGDARAGRAKSALIDFETDIPNFIDEQLLPDAEAFPTIETGVPALAGRLGSSSETGRGHKSSSSVDALMQRKKRIRLPRQLPVDLRQELRNADLADWKENYVANMTEAVISQAHRKAAADAKRNAAYWVVGLGIGGIGAGVGFQKSKSPLDVFSGPAFLDKLRGTPADVGRKRTRNDDNEYDIDSERRNVRTRYGNGDQFGRGEDNMYQDDDTVMVLASDGVEIGRHAEPPLEDPSMPWNISASSRQGSLARRRGFQSSIGGFPTSAGGPAGSLGGPHHSSLDRRASRITSASPLYGRGDLRYSSLEIPAHDSNEILPSRDRAISDPKALEDFELYGPGAGVATQTAAESQWVKSILTQEASNFLEFVRAEIEAREPPVPEEEDGLPTEAGTSVLFEELLPPAQHSKPVGAQGFCHVLALATAGQLSVKQINLNDLDGFGPIRLEVPKV